MGTVLLVLVIVLVVAGLVYGVVSLLSGDDPGLAPVDPDGRARPLPNDRSLSEFDLKTVRFDVGLRGYRMTQVDRVLRRTAYDIGYKDEMIAVLEAEVIALREGRSEDAELLRKAREAAASTATAPPVAVAPAAGGQPPVSGGVHRADPAEVSDTSHSDVLANGRADTDEDDELDEDDETFASTGPGRLNRSALRTVSDPEPSDFAAQVPDAEPTPVGEPLAGDPAAGEPDSAEPDSAEPDSAGPDVAAATESGEPVVEAGADAGPDGSNGSHHVTGEDESADVAAERGAHA